jgi:hypothetical protein
MREGYSRPASTSRKAKRRPNEGLRYMQATAHLLTRGHQSQEPTQSRRGAETQPAARRAHAWACHHATRNSVAQNPCVRHPVPERRPESSGTIRKAKTLPFLEVVKNSHQTPERVVFGHRQTPHCYRRTTVAVGWWLATIPREAQKGQFEKQGLFIGLIWTPASLAAPEGGNCMAGGLRSRRFRGGQAGRLPHFAGGYLSFLSRTFE